MRVHVQSFPTDPAGPFTREQWNAVFGQNGCHDVSFGCTSDDLRAIESEIEVLLVATRGLRALLPINAPKLKIVSVSSAGVDMLAPFDWLPPEVVLLNNSGTHSVKASEFALMGLLMLANRIPQFVAAQRLGQWQPASVRTLANNRLTVVGLGAIGARCAEIASALGMHVTGVRSRPGAHPACLEVVGVEQIDRVLPYSDYLVLSLPGGNSTRHLLDRRRLELLPRGAGIVNVGRGSVLDEDALCDLLDTGKVGGAVLDVFEHEPLSEDSRVWRTPNLVVTPHVSADDPVSYNTLTLRILFDNLAAFDKGMPMPNQIDTTTGLRQNK
jgi:phosphoglycerate dehydrogenase-like enzyme